MIPGEDARRASSIRVHKYWAADGASAVVTEPHTINIEATMAFNAFSFLKSYISVTTTNDPIINGGSTPSVSNPVVITPTPITPPSSPTTSFTPDSVTQVPTTITNTYLALFNFAKSL